jgi:hypothetical protein
MAARRAISSVLETGCTVITDGEQELVKQLRGPQTLSTQGAVRWTPGAALLVSGLP